LYKVPLALFNRDEVLGPGDYRIYEHPILSFKRGRRVTFFFEDQVVEAYEGESILAALYAIGIRIFSYTPDGRGRGPFCMIGKCSSCLSLVNGLPNTRICIEPVSEGVRVYRQRGLPGIPSMQRVDSIETEHVETDALVVGAGPAGLQAALTMAEQGMEVILVNDHYKLGGQLVKQTHRFFGDRRFYGGLRGFAIANELSEKVYENRRITVYTQALAYGFFRDGLVGIALSSEGEKKNLVVKPSTVVIATGAAEKLLAFEGNDLPGVMGAGAAQTLMNEYGVKPGDKAIVVGSGNVGLIVSYQLLQAGTKVLCIAEIMPRVGGWFVHAAKIRRLGVPILTQHTIVGVRGEDRVEEAAIARVDEKLRILPGTEKVYGVDLVLLAIGLQPNYTLVSQAGAAMKYVPELGGLVPVRTLYQETSVPGLYIAGDVSGIEEATTAFIEGRIAGLSAAIKLGFAGRSEARERDQLIDYLWKEYRMSPVVARAREGKLKVTVTEEEMERIRREL